MCGDLFCNSCIQDERRLPAYLTKDGEKLNPDRDLVKVCKCCADKFDQGILPAYARSGLRTPTRRMSMRQEKKVEQVDDKTARQIWSENKKKERKKVEKERQRRQSEKKKKRKSILLEAQKKK